MTNDSAKRRQTLRKEARNWAYDMAHAFSDVMFIGLADGLGFCFQQDDQGRVYALSTIITRRTP